MQQVSTEEVKEVPFDDQMSVEGSWRLRELRSVVGLQRKLSVLRRQRDDETVKMKGFKGFQTFLEAQTTAENDR